LLRNYRKEHRVVAYSELREETEKELNSTCTLITDDESWVYGYGPETKLQLYQWKALNYP
jgi:hypothetical protein